MLVTAAWVQRVLECPGALCSLCGSRTSHVPAGQIKADGGDQQKFDDGMREMRKAGIQAGSCRHPDECLTRGAHLVGPAWQVWPSPDVMEKMGAKDALCKARTSGILRHMAQGARGPKRAVQ